MLYYAITVMTSKAGVENKTFTLFLNFEEYDYAKIAKDFDTFVDLHTMYYFGADTTHVKKDLISIVPVSREIYLKHKARLSTMIDELTAFNLFDIKYGDFFGEDSEDEEALEEASESDSSADFPPDPEDN